MPTLPWLTVNSTPTSPAQVMASRLEVKSLRHVPGFFMASLTLWRQARRSPGVLGLSLKAELLKRTFWTLSAWTGKDAIDAYASSDPHRATVVPKRAVMQESTFVFWEVPADSLPITWAEARRRLDEERRSRNPATE
ncbi:DUF3291 domain-containing protein [Nocardia lijiangensis]|uniref:DUF3291 domain-containing protein n=1 Tax=Nocardia lijiangensis TaxID=299618 RepID=UPI000830433D|nr:DUF3291 domain-containing protein [Nocardia lijiangensis]